MATRILLKSKRDPKLYLHSLRNPISVLTRPVFQVPQPERINEAPQLSLNKASSFPMILGMYQRPFAGVGKVGFSLAGCAVFAEQMGTGRSSSKPRGGSSRDDEDDDFDDDDDGDVSGVDLDDFDEDVDSDDDDDEDFDVDDIEEEENPRKKKTYKRY